MCYYYLIPGRANNLHSQCPREGICADQNTVSPPTVRYVRYNLELLVIPPTNDITFILLSAYIIFAFEELLLLRRLYKK